MVEAYFRGTKSNPFPIRSGQAIEWVKYGLAKWTAKNKIELVRARGAVNPRIGPDLSVRMPPREIEKAAEGYLPSQRRVTRCAFTFIKGFLPSGKQRRLDAILDGVC